MSQIFQWYKNDFGNIIDFIKKYNKKLNDLLEESNKKVEIKYQKYNWKTNNK